MGAQTTTKKTTKKKKATSRSSLKPPFKGNCRQNVVCQLLFSGKTRQETADALPKALKDAGLKETRNVTSLISTTLVGLRKYKGWEVTQKKDGTYGFKPPSK